MANYLFLLLLLACPLMMVFMMRGMHGGRSGDTEGGHGGHGHAGGCGHGRGRGNDGMRHDEVPSANGDSLEELRRRREQLDREIEEREARDDLPTSVGSGGR